MELTKNRITTTNLKAAKYVEFTVDDDFNVPDVKGDIDRQIASKGQVTIENIDVMGGQGAHHRNCELRHPIPDGPGGGFI